MECNYQWLGYFLSNEDEESDKEFLDNLVTIKTDSSGEIILISVD